MQRAGVIAFADAQMRPGVLGCGGWRHRGQGNQRLGLLVQLGTA